MFNSRRNNGEISKTILHHFNCKWCMNRKCMDIKVASQMHTILVIIFTLICN